MKKINGTFTKRQKLLRKLEQSQTYKPKWKRLWYVPYGHLVGSSRQKWIENFGPKLKVIRLDIALDMAVRYSPFTYKALLSC